MAVSDDDRDPIYNFIEERLYPYQIDHINKLIPIFDTKPVLIDGSDTGTGKTYVAIALCKLFNKIPIVVCPKSVIPTWQNAVRKFEITEYRIHNYEFFKGNKSNFATYTTNLVLENGHKPECYLWHRYMPLGDKWVNLEEDLLGDDYCLIFDEAQKCKNHGSINSQLLIGAGIFRQKMMLLSATLASTPKELHVFGFILRLHTDLRDPGWIDRQTAEANGGRHMTEEGQMRYFHECIYPHYGARMTHADIGDAFPTSKVFAYPVDMEENAEKIRRVYRHLEKAVLEGIADLDAEFHVLSVRVKQRLLLETCRIPAIIDMAKEAVDQGYAVAIFVYFRKSVERIAQALGTDCLVYGKLDQATRQENIEKFQNNSSPFIICTIGAGGVGVSLHDPAGIKKRISLISPTYSAQDFRQAIGRVHRAGGADSIQFLIYCADTLEEAICERLNAKLRHIDILNDNSEDETLNEIFNGADKGDAEEFWADYERLDEEKFK